MDGIILSLVSVVFALFMLWLTWQNIAAYSAQIGGL